MTDQSEERNPPHT